MFRRLPPTAGLTLLEILVAVVILGILSGVAIPNMVRYSHHAKVDAAARQVLADFERARSTAIRKNTSVAVVRTSTTGYTIQGVGNRTLEGAAFTSGAVDSVKFAPIGPLMGGATKTWTIVAGPYTRTVRMSAGGRGSVQ